MIWLSARLATGGGKHAVAAFAITFAALAMGTTLLLAALSVEPAMQARDDRTAWRSNNDVLPADTTQPHTAMLSVPQFHPSGTIDTVWLAPSGPDAPVFPGLNRNPRPDEIFVSPAVAELMESSPVLADRYGEAAGIIGDSALTGPDHTLVVRYLAEAPVSSAHVELVTTFSTESEISDIQPELLQLLVAVGIVGLLAPVVLLVAAATRLTAASREHRLAGLRLAGATRKQVLFCAAAESTYAGAGGAILGVALFYAVRPLLAYVTYDGDRWFVSDFTPGLVTTVVVAVGVTAVATLSSLFTLRGVALAPLAVAQRSMPVHLGMWRVAAFVLMVGAGIVIFVANPGRQALALAGAASLLVGFVVLGPWMTRLLGRVMARAGGAALLLAGRRLVDDPRVAFRAIAGVALAVFAATVFTATTPAAVASVAPENYSATRDGAAQSDLNLLSATESSELVAAIRDISGISDTVLVYSGSVHNGAEPAWIGDCRRIAAVVAIDADDCGTADVHVANSLGSWGESTIKIGQLDPADMNGFPVGVVLPSTSTAPMEASSAYDAPAIIVSTKLASDQVARLRPNRLLLRFESPAALEKARTLVQDADPTAQLISGAEAIDGSTRDSRQTRSVLVSATLAAFVIAALALLATTSVSLLERRMPFGLLRATGVRLSVLHSAILLEAAVPVVTGALLAAALGLTASWALTSSAEVGLPMVWALAWPPLAGVAGTLGLIAASLTAVRRFTDVEQLRFE